MLVVVALGSVLLAGLEQPGVALAFGLLVAVGEAVRVRLPDADTGVRARTGAPLSAAAALGYALLGEVGGRPATHGVLQCVAVVVLAGLLGAAPQLALGRAPSADYAVRSVLATAFAAVCCQPLYGAGAFGPGTGQVLVLLGVALLTGLCDAVLAAVLAAGRTGRPVGPLLRERARARPGVVCAVAATGTVLAPGVAAAGLWALPVLCAPLLLTRFASRRRAAVHTTRRQTVAALARAAEVAGCAPRGHARRVAALSRAVGRELGLREPELTVLEYAALLHDVGRLSLPDPVPGGAAEPPALARRIAALGGAVARETGVPAAVASAVERQADPYREQPFTARIVRTSNAYADMVSRAVGKEAVERGNGTVDGSLRALERLRLGSAYDYEPRVVEALARVVSRGPAA
ncbi:HD domain-containing protein [Streptomyces sp. HNM0574]|nr:HD domain-containing protein [Streptomyces sp. HNM0574]